MYSTCTVTCTVNARTRKKKLIHHGPQVLQIAWRREIPTVGFYCRAGDMGWVGLGWVWVGVLFNRNQPQPTPSTWR